MTDEEILKIQREIENGMNQEDLLLQEIDDVSNEVAIKLVETKLVKTKFQNDVYCFAVAKYPGYLVVFGVRELDYKIRTPNSTLKKATVTMDSRVSLKNNIKAGVEAILRQVTGLVQAEELTD